MCDWLSDASNGPWLLILDNVDDDDLFQKIDKVRGRPLEGFLPQSANGSILITSRNELAALNLVGTHENIIQVEPMTLPEALALLQSRVAFEAPSEDATMLVRTLEYIPLAVTHAGAYIATRRKMGFSIASYLNRLQTNDTNQALLLSNSEFKDPRRDYSGRIPVIKTWQISFEQIRSETPEATNLLAFMSMFDRQGIPAFLLEDCKSNSTFEDTITPLIRFSLVTIQGTKRLFGMHRLVQLSTIQWLKASGDFQKWKVKAFKALALAFPYVTRGTWNDCAMLLPHSQKVLSDLGEHPSEQLAKYWILLLNRTTRYMIGRGDYRKAEVLLRQGVRIGEKALKVEDKRLLMAQCKLGYVLGELEEYAEAEAVYRKVLMVVKTIERPGSLQVPIIRYFKSICEEGDRNEDGQAIARNSSGRLKEDPKSVDHNLLKALGNFGRILKRQGKHHEAEDTQRKVYETLAYILGPGHPDTLSSATCLAVSLEEHGKHKEAEAFYQQTIIRYDTGKNWDLDDILVLCYIKNHGILLSVQQKYAEAEPFARQVLRSFENLYGLEHRRTIRAAWDLARSLKRQETPEKIKEAEALYRQYLEKNQKFLEPDNPVMLEGLEGLSRLLKLDFQLEEAESIARQHLTICETTWGRSSQQACDSADNLARILEGQNKYDESETIRRHNLAIYEKVPGEKHFRARRDVASLLCMQHRYEEADALLRQNLERCVKDLGEEALETERTVDELACLLEELGRDEDAESIRTWLSEGNDSDTISPNI